MNPVQYIIINKGLKMTPGKMAAQAAHAAVEGVRISAKTPGSNPWDSSIVNRWYRGGHYAKVVLEVEDEMALRRAYDYIQARGFNCIYIIDEGLTEFDGQLTSTAIGCEIVDKDWPHARETFSAFKLYADHDCSERKPITLDYATANEREDLYSDIPQPPRPWSEIFRWPRGK